VSAATSVRGSGMAWSARTARWVIVAVHVVILAEPPFVTSFGLAGNPATGAAVLALPAGLAVLALQLRHSFAIARGERPRGVPWTLLALAVLVYLPLPWWGWPWVAMQACLLASVPMLLHRWPLAVALAAPVVGTGLAVVVLFAGRQPASTLLYGVCYETFTLVALAAALYGSARLVRVLAELHATRAELAELAVGRERLRVSRDLHDLLGQSLSAISLKGDLALRLLPRDPTAARAEIAGLTGVARDALRGVRAVTRDEHAVSLRGEAQGAAALLGAAGIAAHVDVDLSGLAPAVEAVLAWAVREGVTNVLRHSQASTCQITAGRRDGMVWLEIGNDGAGAPAGAGGGGRGLAGLAERARALAGSVAHQRTRDGRFRLLVEVPEVPEVAEEEA
jgi:two-component system, NarL family, sensor histidine kinase DesK